MADTYDPFAGISSAPKKKNLTAIRQPVQGQVDTGVLGGQSNLVPPPPATVPTGAAPSAPSGEGEVNLSALAKADPEAAKHYIDTLHAQQAKMDVATKPAGTVANQGAPAGTVPVQQGEVSKTEEAKPGYDWGGGMKAGIGGLIEGAMALPGALAGIEHGISQTLHPGPEAIQGLAAPYRHTIRPAVSAAEQSMGLPQAMQQHPIPTAVGGLAGAALVPGAAARYGPAAARAIMPLAQKAAPAAAAGAGYMGLMSAGQQGEQGKAPIPQLPEMGQGALWGTALGMAAHALGLAPGAVEQVSKVMGKSKAPETIPKSATELRAAKTPGTSEATPGQAAGVPESTQQQPQALTATQQVRKRKATAVQKEDELRKQMGLPGLKTKKQPVEEETPTLKQTKVTATRTKQTEAIDKALIKKKAVEPKLPGPDQQAKNIGTNIVRYLQGNDERFLHRHFLQTEAKKRFPGIQWSKVGPENAHVTKENAGPGKFYYSVVEVTPKGSLSVAKLGTKGAPLEVGNEKGALVLRRFDSEHAKQAREYAEGIRNGTQSSNAHAYHLLNAAQQEAKSIPQLSRYSEDAADSFYRSIDHSEAAIKAGYKPDILYKNGAALKDTLTWLKRMEIQGC